MNTNYLFPLPVPIHVAFCIIGFIFFLLQYFRKKYTYHLLLSFAIPSTLLIYLCRSDTAFSILGLEELILFVLIIVSIIINRRKLKKDNDIKDSISFGENLGDNHEDSNS